MAAVKLRSAQGRKIRDFLNENPKVYVGQERQSRRFIEGVLWMMRSGAQWRLIPKKYGNQERLRSVKPRTEGIISGGQARTFGQQGVSQDFSGTLLRLLPADAGCLLPFLTHQFERSVDQFGVLQVGGVGQALT